MTPYEQGRDYVDSMRAVAELNALQAETLLDYYLENIEHLAKRWTHGVPAQAFDGIHDALLDQLNELVHQQRHQTRGST